MAITTPTHNHHRPSGEDASIQNPNPAPDTTCQDLYQQARRRLQVYHDLKDNVEQYLDDINNESLREIIERAGFIASKERDITIYRRIILNLQLLEDKLHDKRFAADGATVRAGQSCNLTYVDYMMTHKNLYDQLSQEERENARRAMVAVEAAAAGGQLMSRFDMP